MTKIAKLVPLAEYRKPLLKLRGDDNWIVKRLQLGTKDMAEKIERSVDESNLPGISDKITRALKTRIIYETEDAKKLNELIRMQKVQAYAEQIRHNQAINANCKTPESKALVSGLSEFFADVF